jgi:chromosome partitioning protein
MPTRQANSTSGVGFDPRNIKTSITSASLMMKIRRTLFSLPRHRTCTCFLRISNLVGAEIEMINLPQREQKMKGVLEKVRKEF